jgi:carboxymethylenebutenolidase
MCDETTGRTERGADGAGQMAAFATPQAGLEEAMVGIPTEDGTCDAFFVHPKQGKHPGVILWPDAIGLRPAKHTMARRLAADGFAVLAVNPYYRFGAAPLPITMETWRTPEGLAWVMPLVEQIDGAALARDARALVAFLDAQPAVDTNRGIGVQGYCMGGPFSLRTVAAVPERIKAVGTFHGGGMVNGTPDSPHLLIASTQASYLVAVALDDDVKTPDDRVVMRETLAAAGRPAEVELYRADHGWCVPDAPAYDPGEADRAHARLLALYAGL